jgi:hypothetical protein
MEIKYQDGFIIEHEGKLYSEEDILRHISQNGHPRELTSFYLPITTYFQAKEISSRLEAIFNEKEQRARMRKRLNL